MNYEDGSGDCKQILSDLKPVTAWSNVFDHPQKINQTLYGMTQAKLGELQTDINWIETELKNSNF